MRRLAHGHEGAHAELFQVLALEHLELELEIARQLLRLLGEIGRRADIRGQVAERAREIRAIGGRDGFLECLLELRVRRERQRDIREHRHGRFLLRLQLVEAVERFARGEHRLAHVPAERPIVHLGVDEKERRVLGAKLAQRVAGAAQRIAVRALGELVLRAEADQQHAFGGDIGQRAQQERRACFTGEIGERRGECTLRALIDASCGGGELLFCVDAKHDAARFRRLGRERAYAKFHSESIA